MKYFFTDPFEEAIATTLLPEDIGAALKRLGQSSTEYKLFVRTGRHFRAEVLPELVDKALTSRNPVTVEVILLDFRDDAVTEAYARFRMTASFDRKLWSKAYVQQEILATIVKLIEANSKYGALVSVNLYLSSRLSTFRIDGSSDELIVTREDPKDMALRYRRSDGHFSAFMTEFIWIREEAKRVELGCNKLASTPISLEDIFPDCAVVAQLADNARAASSDPSPYAR